MRPAMPSHKSYRGIALDQYASGEYRGRIG
jgi:hypothetical protein